MEAASTVFQTTSISSPTFASAGAVSCTFVVPWTGGSPEIGGGTHSVAYVTSAAWAGLAASSDARAAEHQRDPGRAHPPLRVSRCPFVVGGGRFSGGAERRMSGGAESWVNHGSAGRGGRGAWRRRAYACGARGGPPGRRGGGRTLSTTAMPIRKTAAGTTTQSSTQKSVTPHGRPTPHGCSASTFVPYRRETW